MLNGPIAKLKLPRRSTSSPVQNYKTLIDENDREYINRLVIGTPVTGLVRIEWVAARYGQTIPMNWSFLYMNQFLNSYLPLRYQVADAQNLIVKYAIEKEMEWLLLIEHDVILPPNAFMAFNEYMIRADTPVVSGLYFCRGRPSFPLVFRGRGNSVYTEFELGDQVWCDGIPTGVLLIHMGLIREMWTDSESYVVGGQTTRRVFDTPRDVWYDPEDPNNMSAYGGTSDLNWCKRVMDNDYLGRSGWTDYADKEHPFLIDTNIFCKHINPDGEQFP